MADDGVFRFDMVVSGRRQMFEFDPDGTKMLGNEAQLIERHAGRVLDWWSRVESGADRATAVDMMLVVFIAAVRAQVARHGSSQLIWDDFIATIAPFTLRPIDEIPADEQPSENAQPAPAKTSARRRSPSAKTAAKS